jgi:hypothetical protein
MASAEPDRLSALDVTEAASTLERLLVGRGRGKEERDEDFKALRKRIIKEAPDEVVPAFLKRFATSTSSGLTSGSGSTTPSATSRSGAHSLPFTMLSNSKSMASPATRPLFKRRQPRATARRSPIHNASRWRLSIAFISTRMTGRLTPT